MRLATLMVTLLNFYFEKTLYVVLPMSAFFFGQGACFPDYLQLERHHEPRKGLVRFYCLVRKTGCFPNRSPVA